jgi:hypothetical protein
MSEHKLEDDGSVASVDPADLKNVWAMQNEVQARMQAHGLGRSGGAISHDLYANACSPDADVKAVWHRVSILRLLAEHLGLLSSWLHDGKLDDVVFNVAAKFPIKRVPIGVLQQGMPLDVQEFIKQIEQAKGVHQGSETLLITADGFGVPFRASARCGRRTQATPDTRISGARSVYINAAGLPGIRIKNVLVYLLTLLLVDLRRVDPREMIEHRLHCVTHCRPGCLAFLPI